MNDTINTDPDSLSRFPEDNTDPDALSRFPAELFDGGTLDCDINSSDLSISRTATSDPALNALVAVECTLSVMNALGTADASEPNKRGPTVKGVPFHGVTRNTSKVRLFTFHRITAHR
jgi:hypothetical protein